MIKDSLRRAYLSRHVLGPVLQFGVPLSVTARTDKSS